MQNKIDVILKKLINEELDKVWHSNKDKEKFNNIFGVGHSDDSGDKYIEGVNYTNELGNEDTAKELLYKISNLILKRGNVRNPKISKLYLLVSDVLKDFSFVYNKNISTIKMILINAKDLGII
jgi:hypothetical protein